MKTRVVTGSRLHFGLLNLPPAEPWPQFVSGTQVPARYFGGIGMMVEEPRVKVSAAAAETWDYCGILSDRLLAIATQLNQADRKVALFSCPPEHVGLGVGTQLSLALGTALTQGRLSPSDLAHQLSRGARSGIGIHGFAHGGFIVDAGKTEPANISALALALHVPQHWHVLLLTPKLQPSWYGQQEKDAFAKLTYGGNSDDAMSRLITTSIVPALQHADLATFGPAITEYNIRAGEMFRSAQNDRYAHPVIGTLVDELLKLGFAGAGQSSWGPTVFAFTEDQKRIEFFQQNVITPIPCSIVVTRGRNQPASVTTG